jgi:hypothetical protein
MGDQEMETNKRIARDWLYVASIEHRVLTNSWLGLDGFTSRDGATALTAAIVRLACGEDVSPQMRWWIYQYLLSPIGFRMIPCRPVPGKKSFPERDKLIADFVREELRRAPREKQAAVYRAVGKRFGMSAPRSVELAIQRSARAERRKRAKHEK